jgi:hypothetical protein
MLERKLRGSAFSNPEIIQSIVDAFESEASAPFGIIGNSVQSNYAPQLKPKFDGRMENYDLKFGGISDNDPSLGIHKGKITLSDQDLKPVFHPVINKIVTSCSSIINSQKTEVM